MRDINAIGKDAVLHEADAAWLRRLADQIYEEGLYTKAIYLRALVGHAKITQTCTCNITNDLHWWGSDECPACAGESIKNGNFRVCALCLHQWRNSKPVDRPDPGGGTQRA